MIAKRVNRGTNDRFRRLAEYIAAAKDAGEKLDDLWVVNADAGDDLDVAISEIEATQAQNTRVTANKSYHLIVSFRDDRPGPEALRDMERHFAGALGFGEHQRVAAAHRNTDNYHLHIAFNKIHPVTGKSLSPHRDFKILEKTCRAMEQKHGLKVDPGRADKTKADRKPQAARDMEVHSWEQSFFGYVQENKEPLMEALDKANGWQDLHDDLARYDLVIRKRGNGLIIGSGPIIGTGPTRHHTRAQHIKASALDRSFSKPALEKRFGEFQEAANKRARTEPVRRYKKKPITRHKDQKHLWQRYMGQHQKRPSLAARSFKNWKEFLAHEALDDLLAMAIIQSHKKVMEMVTTLPKPPRRETRDHGMSL